MKISVDDKELFTLTDTQKKVMRNNIMGDIFEDDLKRRLHWVLTHKYEQCFKELKEEWDSKLKANGFSMVPTDEESYAQLVFDQPNYKDRSTRESSK